MTYYYPGIGVTGTATIDPMYRSASITIAGSNKPTWLGTIWSELTIVTYYYPGIGVTGAATIDPVYRSASITIAGSSNPHGVVQFGQN